PTDHHVTRPERARGEDRDEADPDLTRPHAAPVKADEADQCDSGGRERDRNLAPDAGGSASGDDDRADELQRDRRTERQVVDRDIEGDDHRDQDRAENGRFQERLRRAGIPPWTDTSARVHATGCGGARANSPTASAAPMYWENPAVMNSAGAGTRFAASLTFMRPLGQGRTTSLRNTRTPSSLLRVKGQRHRIHAKTV